MAFDGTFNLFVKAEAHYPSKLEIYASKPFEYLAAPTFERPKVFFSPQKRENRLQLFALLLDVGKN
jgi:hypothetical protein